MMLVFTQRLNNVQATKPAAGGTVPDWNMPQAAGANTLALTSAWALATASNHTTGTWTNATQICVLVLRPDTEKTLNYRTSFVANGANTQTIIYPALSVITTGTSWGVRCGTRGVAVAAAGNAPTGWTQRIVQPATPLMSVHTRAALTANMVADTVATAGTNAAYRAHSLEITESPKQQPMVTIT